MKLAFLDACDYLLKIINSQTLSTSDFDMHIAIKDFDSSLFLRAGYGTSRFVYISRDNDLSLWGLGTAQIVPNENVLDKHNFFDNEENNKYYFIAHKFCYKQYKINEWSHFNNKQFILPLILVAKILENYNIYLYYKSTMPIVLWKDRVSSLLSAIKYSHNNIVKKIYFAYYKTTPQYDSYVSIANKAFKAFDDSFLKVVIARRKTLFLEDNYDPALLFIKLLNQSIHCHCYFIDMGLGSAFFGASPELLYRSNGLTIETESLAGTRASSSNKDEDNKLRHDLLWHPKDIYEHDIVSSYILDIFKQFSLKDIYVSDLSTVSLNYVHHLIKKFKATKCLSMNDAEIIKALHPTPASCGFKKNRALEFILKYEEFDRGLYTGLVGYINKNNIELALAIRSALFIEKYLHIYTGSGLVSGSDIDSEWHELDAKEQNILRLLD